MVVAAFDFDGTLTRRDTMLEFVRFVRGNTRFAWGLLVLAPTLAAFFFGRISNEKAKTRLLTHFLGGMSEPELYALGEAFCAKRLPRHLLPARMAQLRAHQAQGHRCYLVTASLTFWTRAFAAAEGLTLLASQPEIVDGRFTGKLAGANCFGAEKVIRLRAHLATAQLSPQKTYAYGDSSGDSQLLEWADVPTLFRK